MSLVVRPVGEGDIPSWNRLAAARGELFQQSAWVDTIAGGGAKKGIFDANGDLVGGFVVAEQRRFGLHLARNAPFSQSAGPFWEQRASAPLARLEERRKIVEAMAASLEPGRGVTFVRLSSGVEDVLPFRWRDFRTTVEYTYRMALHSSPSERFAHYSESRRRSIRRAWKDGLEAEVTEDARDVAASQRRTLEREKAGGGNSVDSVVEAIGRLPGSFVVNVRRKGVFLAGCLVAVFQGVAYYILGGHESVRDGQGHHGAGALALHAGIENAARIGCEVFDFEGSTIPRVEPFIRGFGGQLTPYYAVAKAWLPIEYALKLRFRRYF